MFWTINQEEPTVAACKSKFNHESDMVIIGQKLVVSHNRDANG